MTELYKQFAEVKSAATLLAKSTYVQRSVALLNIAKLLDSKRTAIKNANALDLDKANSNGLTSAMIDRLRLDDKGIDSIIKAVHEIHDQDEVMGSVIDGSVRPNGLRIEKIRVPLGVVGVIYESRPNVTIDSAALCIKSGNAVILRGGKEAIHSNALLAHIVSDALVAAGLPDKAVYFVKDTDRAIIGAIASAKGLVDVIIPRGGPALINYVMENACIPVIMHDKGVCHVYIDESADKSMALQIAFNAKMSKPSACNAMETLLVHAKIAPAILPDMANMFNEVDADLRSCEKALKYIDTRPAIEEDWFAEYLDAVLAVKVVENIDEAIVHISKYGSGHSEAIVTENYTNAQKFLHEVDASAVYVNASTRFTDGGEFGLGTEIGISTQKLHVRGPMGAKDLTTTKYLIYGNGQLRK